MIVLNLDKYFKKYNGYLVVGVSSGPDSMALLHYLINNTNNKIICCHINHNIRKESDEEELFLKEYCKKNNVIFEVMKIDGYSEKNFENEARKKRYKFYEETLKKYDSKYLFLAHHGDDLIETILMKIVRGSNIEGYAGIKKLSKINNYYIVRPLLRYTKNDLIKYNEENNIKYYIDKSNNDIHYTRNRYRKFILPFLKEEDPNVHLKFLKYSETLTEYDNYIKEEVNKTLLKVYYNNYIDLNKFKKINIFLQKNIIFYLLNNTYNNENSIVKENIVDNIIDIIYNSKPNIFINLPKNIIVKKEYNKLFIMENRDSKISEYKILLNENNIINNKFIIDFIKDTTDNGNDICRLDSKEIELPLFIRNRKEKDYIYVKGLNGKKKIKQIFIEKKMPLKIRESYPLLVDNNDNILWIPGIKKSKFNKTKSENYDIILRYCEKEENNE